MTAAEDGYTTKELLLAAQRAMVPQGHKAMPVKALRKLGALIEAPWNDAAAPDVLRRIRRVWDEMHVGACACGDPKRAGWTHRPGWCNEGGRAEFERDGVGGTDGR